ncbi:hypothetical protein LINPERPRIM_LOCUS25337 [Linum perenne]
METFNEEEPIRSILTWVRLPKLPIHFFNHLPSLASAIALVGRSTWILPLLRVPLLAMPGYVWRWIYPYPCWVSICWGSHVPRRI